MGVVTSFENFCLMMVFNGCLGWMGLNLWALMFMGLTPASFGLA